MAQVRRNKRLEDMEERDQEEAGRGSIPFPCLVYFFISLIMAKGSCGSTQIFTVQANHWPKMQTIMIARIHFLSLLA